MFILFGFIHFAIFITTRNVRELCKASRVPLAGVLHCALDVFWMGHTKHIVTCYVVTYNLRMYAHHFGFFGNDATKRKKKLKDL